MVIAAIVFFILSIATYDDGCSSKSTVFITFFVILNIGIYMITVVNYHKFYSDLYTLIYGLGVIINLIIIAVAIIICIVGVVFKRPYIYITVVVFIVYIYSPLALIGVAIIGAIMIVVLNEEEYSTSSYDTEDTYSFDSSDYDYSNYSGSSSSADNSSSNNTSSDNKQNVFTRRDSSGNMVEYFIQDSSGCFNGSNGNVIMKDSTGGGYHTLDGSVHYYKDRYGDYIGSDGTHYIHDRYGDLVCDNGDQITKD